MPDPPAPGVAALERLACEAAREAAAVLPGASRPEAGRRLARVLTAATPSAGIVGALGAPGRPDATLQWVVDPPAGGPPGRRRAPGAADQAVSVAASLDGEIVAGAVVDPRSGELFCARLDGGARRDGRPVAVSDAGGLGDAVLATGPGGPASLADAELRRPASAALALSWLACGRLDGYFERDLAIWDYSAAALIAAEAGAVVELPCPENDELVVAAAPQLFDALRAAVEPAPEACAS